MQAGDDPLEPLLHDNYRVTPNLSGQLPSGVKDVSVFFTAHSDPSAPEAASLSIQVLRDGKALGGAPMMSREASEAEYSSYLISFSVNPPMDGLYEVKASLKQGEKTAENSVAFTLTGVSADAAAEQIHLFRITRLTPSARWLSPLPPTLFNVHRRMNSNPSSWMR